MLGMLKRRLGCDFDRLREHANTHLVLRQLLGHGEYDPVEYSYDTVLRDISCTGTRTRCERSGTWRDGPESGCSGVERGVFGVAQEAFIIILYKELDRILGSGARCASGQWSGVARCGFRDLRVGVCDAEAGAFWADARPGQRIGGIQIGREVAGRHPGDPAWPAGPVFE